MYIVNPFKALSPNRKVGQHLTTQNRIAHTKCLKRIRDITMVKAAQHRITGKAVLPENCKACTTTAFI
jgi:hypothetical protein